MSHRELAQEHDRDGLSEDYRGIVRDELRHRQIARMTRAMVAMTVVIAVATLFNVAIWAWDKLLC